MTSLPIHLAPANEELTARYAPAWMTPRRSGLLSVLCSTEAFTGLTTRHGWTASQWETWTADALRKLLLQQPP